MGFFVAENERFYGTKTAPTVCLIEASGASAGALRGPGGRTSTREVLGVGLCSHTYILTCWSDEHADELFLDVVCDGAHDAPIGESIGERLRVVNGTLSHRSVISWVP